MKLISKITIGGEFKCRSQKGLENNVLKTHENGNLYSFT